MTNKRVLVVDDSKLNRKLVSTILLANGLEVLEAGDGEIAVALAGEEMPDLILMDVQLPKIDGYEATKRLRADEKTKDIVIIALTAHAMAGESQHAREAGCDGYIGKPIDTRTLMDTLQPFLKPSADA